MIFLGGEMKKYLSVAALLSAALCTNIIASPIAINNPSFELPALACTAGPACFTLSFTGWTIGSGNSSATFKPSVGAGQEFISLAPDGVPQAQVAAVSNGTSGDIFQDLTAVLAANTSYTLTFFVGQRSDLAFNPGYTVSVKANGVTLASDTGATPASGTFVQRTISFSTGASPAQLGQTLRIDVSAPATGAAPTQADFDVFALDATATAVPEPGMFGLMAAGLSLVALGRRGVKRT
jgi:hypothetical protein